MRRIDVIFAIEREINGRAGGRAPGGRARSAIAPLVADLEEWMRTERARLSRHADTAKAIDYMLKRWAAFTRFLDDGRICLTNNAAERALRGIALGRRAWLFAGSDRGGERAAAIYTLIATAKLNDIDPAGLARRRARPHRRSPGLPARRTPALALEDAQRSGRRRSDVQTAAVLGGCLRYLAPAADGLLAPGVALERISSTDVPIVSAEFLMNSRI